MKRKNRRRKLAGSKQNAEIPVTDNERFREEHVAKNDECLLLLGLANRIEKEFREHEEKEKVANKDTVLPVRKSQRFCDPTSVGGGKGSCDDVQPDIAHGDVHLDEGHEESPLASDVPQSAPVGSSSTKDVLAFVKRKKMSQDLYRSIERHAKERKAEGKKPFIVEVSRDGEPIGKNAARWASELGIRCRSHLDICKSNFAEQDPQHVESVIQKMENTFDTIGGQISRKYYKSRMRLLMNSFRYNCRKLIMEGKESLDSTLTSEQWETLKASMRSEEYLTKSKKAKRARDNVRAEYTFGRGGLQAKINKLGVENSSREAGAKDIVNYMTALDPTKCKSSVKEKSSLSAEISQPSVEHVVRASPNHANLNAGYEHIMSYLQSLNERVSRLNERVSQLTSSVEPIVSAWNNHNSTSSYQNNFIKTMQKQKFFDGNGAANIDSDHDELVDKNLQPNHSCAKAEKSFDKLKEGEVVKVLDPYDGRDAGIGRIHSLSIFHGTNLNGTGDANVNIITVSSNVPLAYEDKIDGAVRLKEKEGNYTRWPLKYLEKMA